MVQQLAGYGSNSVEPIKTALYESFIARNSWMVGICYGLSIVPQSVERGSAIIGSQARAIPAGVTRMGWAETVTLR